MDDPTEEEVARQWAEEADLLGWALLRLAMRVVGKRRGMAEADIEAECAALARPVLAPPGV